MKIEIGNWKFGNWKFGKNSKIKNATKTPKHMKNIILLLTLLFIFGINAIGQKTEYHPSKISKAKHFRKTIPLRDMEKIVPGERDRSWKNGIIRNEENKKTERQRKDGALPIGKDPVLQDYQGQTYQSKSPLLNFDGIGNVNGVFPPDTEGDVGLNHYFQMINLSFAIWDKEGNKIYGPVDNYTLWSGFIGPWTGTNDGDPILLYDEQADRWLASQFAINTSNGTYWELIAISETGDPLGAYYQYAFEFPAFNDYPKFGVWHDGYYASFNMFGSYFRGAAAAFERDLMLIGDSTAQMILFDLPQGSDPANMLPSDLDGTPAPAGTPNYFTYFNDDAWGYPDDRMNIWAFDADWVNPANSTFTEVAVLTTEAFDSQLCTAPRGQCVPQPNTNIKLETLSDRLMYRLQYRNFGSYQVMLTNHTVDVDVNHSGIRWYEMRDNNDGNGWFIYQQGTYAPDENHRWMGSIAMNGQGDIALGYTISSDSLSPSVRYTGQTQGATLGEMNIAEVELIRGTASQSSFHRWGDYSCMSVDPSDDSTFWFTEEYMKFGWMTRISSFNFEPVSPATVSAGENDTVCENQIFYTDGSGTNFTSVLWTSMGDGFFPNKTSLNAMYWRGSEDLENGEANLVLTVYGYIPGNIISDTILLTYNYMPEVSAGNDTLICEGNLLTLSGYAIRQDSLLWTTSGDGTFNNDTILNPVYTPGENDITNGSVELTLTASATVPCTDSVSDVITLTIDECTNISDLSEDRISVKIQPNPTKGIFTISISNAECKIVEVNIHDMKGNLILKETLRNIDRISKEFDLSSYPKGVYFIEVICGDIRKTEKILIQ